MKGRKVVLFIVEGPSDQSALSVVLSRVFDQNEVFVYVVHGDVTAAHGASPQNIIAKVGAFIKEHMSRYRLRKVDMLKVIHLMDTDGAYIPDEAVAEIPTARETVYNPSQIIAPNRHAILERNEQKRSNMDKLASVQDIAGIRYQAVYMSCNLDHVLYNKLNSRNEDKRRDSIEFARKYRQDIEGFISFVTESDFSVNGSSAETWSFIRQGLRSIERHTNIGICFPS